MSVCNSYQEIVFESSIMRIWKNSVTKTTWESLKWSPVKKRVVLIPPDESTVKSDALSI